MSAGALTFNLLLEAAGLLPSDVRLLRHETRRHGITPYALWREAPERFDDYQRLQKRERAAYFASPVWASFVVFPDGGTLFVGCYAAELLGMAPPDWVDPISGRDPAAFVDYDLYRLQRLPALADLIGRLVVDWGAATRSWAQIAANQPKPIIELRRSTQDPPFPGFSAFLARLSDLASLPSGWRTALAHAHGVYLLTCPRTKEQYVGSATGADGFLGRWRDYVDTGHGGNVALKSREPSDYQVSILQVAGSADTSEDVLAMERLWKAKLQSLEMGLNRNR